MKINTLQKYWKSLVVTTIVLVLSFAPFGPIVGIPEFRFTDKLIHVFMYMFYTLVLMFDYRRDTRLHLHPHSFRAICLGLPFLVGGITELLQLMLFAPRSGEFLDFSANTIGVLLAWGLYTLFRKIK